MGPKQVLPLCIRVDLEVMIINKYATLLWSSELELRHQMQFSFIPRIIPD